MGGGRMEMRWKHNWRDGQTAEEDGKEWRCTVYRLLHTLNWLIKMLSGIFQAETTDKDEFRTTAGPYATSALLHQAHMSRRKRDIATLGETDGNSSPPWLQGSGIWLVTRLLPVGLPSISTCCTCLTLRRRGLVLLIRFQHESVFEACRWNPKPSLSVLCVPDWNHQLSSSSTQLVDTSTSATVIWDTIILLCDTLYVSTCNLVYLRG